jgi:hypothetical protein
MQDIRSVHLTPVSDKDSWLVIGETLWGDYHRHELTKMDQALALVNAAQFAQSLGIDRIYYSVDGRAQRRFWVDVILDGIGA